MVHQGNGHDEHEQVLAVLLLFGADDAGLIGRGELEADVVAADHIEHLDEEFGIEADNHVVALVAARNDLFAFVREVQVLGLDAQAAIFEREFDLVSRFVGKIDDTLERVEEIRARNPHDVGVLLGDNRVEVRVAGINQAAAQGLVAEIKESIGFAESDLHRLAGVGQGRFEQIEGFFGQNQRSRDVELVLREGDFDQFVGICGDKGQAVFIELEEHPRHSRAQFVIARGKKRFVDTFKENRSRNLQGAHLIGFGDAGEVTAVLASQLVATKSRGNGHRKGIGIDLDSDWLYGQTLERIHEDFARNGYGQIRIGLNLQLSRHESLDVTGRQDEGIVLNLKEEIFENGQDGIVANGTVDDLQLLFELGRGNRKTHKADGGFMLLEKKKYNFFAYKLGF